MKTQEQPARISVLVVEDDPMAVRLVQEMLREPGGTEFRMSHADRLSEARRALIDEGADCVLLDLRLPDASWLEALTDLRAVDPDVPIVVLSGLEDEAFAFTAVQSGAQDYLVKGSVDAERLMRSIKYAIERKRTERGYARLAFHDSLTGLPNRDLFMEQLIRALARLDRHADSIAVLFIDLDHFKPINDTHGHVAGDAILVEVAQRLKSSMRPSDTVARYGGDEFIVLCEEITDDLHAESIADRLASVLSKPFELETAEVSVAASIGMATTTRPDVVPEQMIADADAAMYRSKQARRSVNGTRAGTAAGHNGR